MTNVKELASSDYFFYYDKIAVDVQNERELVELLLQPTRSLFYSRTIGGGIHEAENFPNAITLQVGLRYNIVNGAAVRNTRVVEGSSGLKDRRIALGQESIRIDQKNGQIDLTVWYVNIYNYEQVNNLKLPIGSR